VSYKLLEVVKGRRKVAVMDLTETHTHPAVLMLQYFINKIKKLDIYFSASVIFCKICLV